MSQIEEFARFGDLLPEAMLLVTSDGQIITGNRQLASLTGGRGAAELIGQSLIEFAGDAGEAAGAWLRACARTRSLLPGTLRIARSGGGFVTCRAAGGLYRPPSGQEPGVILVRLTPKHDAVNPFVALNLRIEELSAQVARRRAAEAALRAEQEWLRVTLESIGDAVLSTDRGGHVTFMNPVAEALTGWSLEDALGRLLDDVFVIINEHTSLPVTSPVARVLRDGVVVGLANHTILVRRDGSRLPIDDSGAPIRDEQGALIGVVLVFHDVSESRRLERELEARNLHLVEADQRKDEFLAMLAHELRNPLAPLSSGIDVLRASRSDPQALAELGEMMNRQIQHLTYLVNELLDVSRITRGRIELQRERIALEHVLHHALEMVDRQIEKHGHELSLTLPPQTMPVYGDHTRLAQVFANLLSNAVKFTDPGGRLTLSAAASGATFAVSLRDTGIGIEPEMLSGIFELFAQADRSLDRSRGGLGLGLTVARRVVAMHGGTIEARSEGPGSGSEFIVELPALEADSAAPEPGRRAIRAPEPVPCRRVLVVDDNHDAADTLGTLLRLWGHDVRVAHDGVEALANRDRFTPELVLLDLGLPGMDGFEVARRMRQHPDLRRARLVALTGYGREQDREVSREAGFDEHVTKPVEATVLERLLDDCASANQEDRR